MIRVTAASAAALLLLSCGGGEPNIAVSDGWARETAASQTSAAAYAKIANRGDGEDRLTGVSSPAASGASLHSSSEAGGVMRMRPIEGGLEVRGKSTVAFEPGGNHIMLTGLKQPLRAGQTVQLTLTFDKSPPQTIAVRVMPATATDSHHGMAM